MMSVDNAMGCLVGLAVGGAWGPLEFSEAREPENYLTEYTTGVHGTFRGEWTDDTAMFMQWVQFAKKGFDANAIRTTSWVGTKRENIFPEESALISDHYAKSAKKYNQRDLVMVPLTSNFGQWRFDELLLSSLPLRITECGFNGQFNKPS